MKKLSNCCPSFPETLSTEPFFRDKVFQNAPVSLWVEDYTPVVRAVEKLNAPTIRGLNQYLKNHPEFVDNLFSKIRVIDANPAAVRLHEADNKADLLGSLQKVCLPETLPMFHRQIRAVFRKKTMFHAQTAIRTLKGNRRFILLRIQLVPGPNDSIHSIVSHVDITRQKQLEKRLRQSEKMFRSVIQLAPIGFAMVDPDGRIFKCNDALARMLEYDPAELLNMDVAQFTHPDDLEKELELLQAMLDGHTDHFRMEQRHITKTGRTVWANVATSKVSFDKNAPPFYFAFVEDITSRKASEEALMRTKNILEKAEVLSDQGSWEWDLVRDQWTVSDNWLKLFAFDRKRVSTKEVFGFTYEKDKPLVDAAVQKILDGEPDEGLEFRIVRKDTGQPRYVKVLGEVIFDQNKKPLKMLGVARDIDHRKKARDKLEKSEKKFKDLFMQIPVSTLIFQTAGNDFILKDFNKAAFQLTRGVVKRMVRTPVSKIFKDRPDFLADIEKCARTKTTIRKITRFKGKKCKDDLFVIIHYSFVEPDMVIMHTVDITDQKKMETELILAKEAAEKASRAKSMFLANMSHEIRTPMNVVYGFTQILRDRDYGPLNEKQGEYIGYIMESIQRLMRLINDILDISRIEAGKAAIDNGPFSVPLLMERIAMETRGPAGEKNLDFKIRMDPLIPEPVVGDELKIEQVLKNLVENAIKFTPKGEVRVTAAMASETELIFRVKDTGIGVSKEKMGRLFESFYQVDSGLSRKYSGTGLGLAICRELVNIMGGRIRVESRAGQGSRFSFTVPVGK